MSTSSRIEWTDATINPITGCSHAAHSRGCDACYAERLTGTRLAHLPQYAGLTDGNGHWTGEGRRMMMTGIKLTDRDGRTFGDIQWGPGVTHEAPGTGSLCGPGWIHIYDSAEIAAFMNPIQGKFLAPRFWKCEWSGETCDDCGLKRGVQRCTTVEEIAEVSPVENQRVAFGIYCAREVYIDADWNAWAAGWLNGHDRLEATAVLAAWAAAAAWAALAAKAVAKAKADLDLGTIARKSMRFEKGE